MLFFGEDKEVGDSSMMSLRRLITLVDTRFAEIKKQIAAASEEGPLNEEGDDLVGFGFVACQRYLTEITKDLKLNRGDALGLGPTLESGQTIVSIINSAANAWKHESEWDYLKPPGKRTKQTQQQLAWSLPDHSWDYKYVNALHALTPDMRFATVAASLVEWRDAMIAKSRAAPPS